MKDDWTGRRVAVVGLGVENTPLARYLAGRGAIVTGMDRRPATDLPAAGGLAKQGVRLVTGAGYLRPLQEEVFDDVFLTPGMIKTLPEVESARRAGARISSQTNLLFRLCKAPIIGVTGTSGKSTTSSLIAHVLTEWGRRPVFLGGNLGRVLIDEVERIPADAWVVLELSSFQLELLEHSPHIGVLLNIYPNHLDVHGDMEAYATAKRRIFQFQQAARRDTAILFHDDAQVRDLASAAPAETAFFGTQPGLTRGATVARGQVIVLGGRGRPRPVMTVDRIPLPGAHNVKNVLAATAAAAVCGVPPEVIRRAVESFQGLPHRLETVATAGGVRFVNDSIATTPDRAAAALRSFREPVVLLAGGYDKGIPFTDLAAAVVERPPKALVLTGATAVAIENAVREAFQREGRQVPRLVRARSFDEAFRQAAGLAEPGDVVLLSPACASYDQFANFVERGLRFRHLAEQWAARPS